MNSSVTAVNTVSKRQDNDYFPKDHPLHALKRVNYPNLLDSLSRFDISLIYNSSKFNEERRCMRTCYSEVYGPGSELTIPVVGCYLHSKGKNAVFMPDDYTKTLDDGATRNYPAIDSTIIEYMRDIGFLGKEDSSVIYVTDLEDLKGKLEDSGRKTYNVDDYGVEYDHLTANSQENFDRCNSKDQVHKLTSYSPEQFILNIFDLTEDHYKSMSKDGSDILYLKTCNTESAGAGVWRIHDKKEFFDTIREIEENTLKYNLSPQVIIQPEIIGINKSFQVFIDPLKPEEIQIIALTNQIVGEDKIRYIGSVNLDITSEKLEIIGPAILDLINGIKKEDPNTFGFIMCDYFEQEDGSVVLFDPGLRPTGNTPSAMVKIWFEHNNPGQSITVTNCVHFDHNQEGITYAEVAEKLGEYAEPETILKTGYGVLPWGHNHIGGKSLFMIITPTEDAYEEFRSQIFKILSK